MPDIQLRFNLDMLVLSAPIDKALASQGVDVASDREFITLIEPDAIQAAYRMESIAGAQCLVTNTAGITAARLAHQGMEDRGKEFATAALEVIDSLHPQHVLVEIGPTLLPIDASSKVSMKQNRDQYAQAIKNFGEKGFDACLLNGMVSIADLKCALMGVRMVYDGPVFASVEVDSHGRLAGRQEHAEDAFATMAESGADVVGFSTGAPIGATCEIARKARSETGYPVLVQLDVKRQTGYQDQPTEENPYYCADTMIEAATLLRGAGAQFLRAVGEATPAYTGALAAASAGFDVIRKAD